MDIAWINFTHITSENFIKQSKLLQMPRCTRCTCGPPDVRRFPPFALVFCVYKQKEPNRGELFPPARLPGFWLAAQRRSYAKSWILVNSAPRCIVSAQSSLAALRTGNSSLAGSSALARLRLCDHCGWPLILDFCLSSVRAQTIKQQNGPKNNLKKVNNKGQQTRKWTLVKAWEYYSHGEG